MNFGTIRLLLLLLISGAVVAGGCSDNVTSNAALPGAPASLQALSVDDSTVQLQWGAPAGSGVTGYSITWRGERQQDVGGTEATQGTTVRISSLRSHQPYTFYVATRHGSVISSPAAITWAGASRFDAPQFGDSLPMRIYEQGSPLGNGLVLDPALGGPRRVDPATPPYSALQLAVRIGTDSVDIGPAFVVLNGRGDSLVAVSARAFVADSLNGWYSAVPVSDEIPADGYQRFFRFPLNLAHGQGFYVRTGRSGEYHYARILVRSQNGSLVRVGSSGRYLELSISYQEEPDLPYAGFLAP